MTRLVWAMAQTSRFLVLALERGPSEAQVRQIFSVDFNFQKYQRLKHFARSEKFLLTQGRNGIDEHKLSSNMSRGRWLSPPRRWLNGGPVVCPETLIGGPNG
jgi:hypothetical protein